MAEWPSVMVPHRAQAVFAQCVMVALAKIRSSPASDLGLKLLLTIPDLLLRPLPRGARGLQSAIIGRCTTFLRGEWADLRRDGPREQQLHVEQTEERAFRNAQKLVKEGQLRRAMQCLAMTEMAPANDATLAELQRLHPGRNHAIPAPPVSQPPPAIVLEREHFDKVFRALPRASAPGSSQMRWEHLEVVFRNGGSDLLFAVCQSLAEGDIPPMARPWVAGARLVAICKGRPPPPTESGALLPRALRPIACGEVIRKLVGKVICAQKASAFVAHFCPDPDPGASSTAAQLGVALSGGADIGVHTVQKMLADHPDFVVATVDARNAFNALSRGAMFAAVLEDFPELYAFTAACYEDPPNLLFRTSEGPRIIASAEGTQQGDPLGCLYLAAPLQKVLTVVRRAHPGVHILAYIDDVFFLGPAELVRSAYDDYETALGSALGLESQPSKCQVYSPEGDCSCFPADMPGAVEPLEGLEVLGVPVGSPEYVRRTMAEIVADCLAVLPMLQRFPDAQSQGLLLRFCAHPRMVHWLRGVSPEDILPAATTHHAAILQLFKDITPGPPLSAVSEEVISFPLRHGGLGLTSGPVLSPAAWLGSWAQSWGVMCRLFPLLENPTITDLHSPLPLVQSLHAAWDSINTAATEVQALRDAGWSTPPGTPDIASLPSVSDFSTRVHTKAQKAYASMLHARKWLALHHALAPRERAWLNSISTNSLSTQFLRAIPRHSHFRLGAAHYQCAVRHLLLAPQPAVAAIQRCGGCGGAVDPCGLHYISCRGGYRAGNWFTYVHNALLEVVKQMLRSVFPTANIIVEDAVGAAFYSPRHRPDITVLDYDGSGTHLLVDVSVLRPLCQHHLRAAAAEPGRAAAAAEAAKIAVYGDVGQHRMVPFVMEEFGLLGPATSRFFMECVRARRDRLDLEGRLATWSARSWSSFWRQRLSITLARALADTMIRRAQADYVLQ